MANVPVKAPVGVQVLAFCEVQLTTAVPLVSTSVASAVTLTLGASHTVSCAVALTVPPAPLQLMLYVAPLAVVTACEPAGAKAPDHPPVAVQAVAFCDDQVSVTEVLMPTSAADAASDAVGAGVGVGVGVGVEPPPAPPPPQADKPTSSNKAAVLEQADAN